MASGAKLGPLRDLADLERADGVCALSSRQVVLQDMWDLIRGSRVRALEGRHPALGSSHLLAEVHRVLAAYYDRWAGARPQSVDQAAHAPPDVPMRELGRVRPPVRDILGRGSPGLRRLLFLCHAPPSQSGSSRLSIEQSSTDQNRYTT